MGWWRSFWDGFGSIINLAGGPIRLQRMTDAEAISGDWEAVLGDLRRAEETLMIRERCEWNPRVDRPAQTPPAEGDCENNATLSVGVVDNWHLCKPCSDRPVFARMKKSELPDRMP